MFIIAIITFFFILDRLITLFIKFLHFLIVFCSLPCPAQGDRRRRHRARGGQPNPPNKTQPTAAFSLPTTRILPITRVETTMKSVGFVGCVRELISGRRTIQLGNLISILIIFLVNLGSLVS
jgi:hypothetical protein